MLQKGKARYELEVKPLRGLAISSFLISFKTVQYSPTSNTSTFSEPDITLEDGEDKEEIRNYLLLSHTYPFSYVVIVTQQENWALN